METVVHDAPSGQVERPLLDRRGAAPEEGHAAHEQPGDREARRDRAREGSPRRQSDGQRFALSPNLGDTISKTSKEIPFYFTIYPAKEGPGPDVTIELLQNGQVVRAADAGASGRRERPSAAARTAADRSAGRQAPTSCGPSSSRATSRSSDRRCSECGRKAAGSEDPALRTLRATCALFCRAGSLGDPGRHSRTPHADPLRRCRRSTSPAGSGTATLRSQSPAAARADHAYSSAATAILVDVVVRDRKGRPVTDLIADDFEVYEDGVGQKVDTFSRVSRGGGIGVGVAWKAGGSTTSVMTSRPVPERCRRNAPDRRHDRRPRLRSPSPPNRCGWRSARRSTFVPMTGNAEVRVGASRRIPAFASSSPIRPTAP